MSWCAGSALLSALVSVPIVLAASAVPAATNEPLVVKQSAHDTPTTVERLQAAVISRGASVVAKIDHAAAAQASGLSLRPTVVMLIGNPKLGTPLMQSRQTVGLDLPLRVLVWQDEGEVTHVGYTPPAVIVARYDIRDRSDVVEKMTGALAAITDEATAP
jgi:uncharacterized protein (DUF302 family)